MTTTRLGILYLWWTAYVWLTVSVSSVGAKIIVCKPWCLSKKSQHSSMDSTYIGHLWHAREKCTDFKVWVHRLLQVARDKVGITIIAGSIKYNMININAHMWMHTDIDDLLHPLCCMITVYKLCRCLTPSYAALQAVCSVFVCYPHDSNVWVTQY